MLMLQFMSMHACSQDSAGSVNEMFREAKNISQAFAAVAEGGNRQALRYKAILSV